MDNVTTNQPEPIRVLIVDDHPLVRDGLRVLLLATLDMTLAAEAATGEDAINLCATTDIDVVLMDLKMPGMGGLAAIQHIHRTYPRLKLIALTSFSDKELVEQALQSGATSYILKDSSSSQLAAAIRGAVSGQTIISGAAAQKLIPSDAADRPPLGSDLTKRELQVLALIVAGLGNSEIGQRLAIRPATVNFHVGNILSKLEAANRTEAAARALQLGLVSESTQP